MALISYLTTVRIGFGECEARGDDREARAELMMGAVQGGLCFQKGLGAVPGLSHALGSLASPSLHHGTLNAC
jgi:hypothetical protein